MASVINRITKQYFMSVNTPDYPESDWIINPDLSAVANVPAKYWKIDGDSVVEMTTTEKSQVEAAGIPQKVAARIMGAMDFGKKLMVDYGTTNVLRGYTMDQVRAISAKLSEVQTLLLSGSLYCAKQAITDMTPDENVTQSDKDIFLAKINAYLGL